MQAKEKLRLVNSHYTPSPQFLAQNLHGFAVLSFNSNVLPLFSILKTLLL